MCRVSPSFVRFGTFQLPAMRGGDQLPLVRTLADYVIRHLYPHLEGELPIHLPHLSRMNTLGSHNTSYMQAVIVGIPLKDVETLGL